MYCTTYHLWQCLAVTFTIGVTRAQNIENADNLVVASNYGVVFTPVDRVINGASMYPHTFQVELPELSYEPLRQIACDTPELQLIQCEAINDMVSRLNEDVQPMFEHLKTRFEYAISAVNTIGDVETKDPVPVVRSRRQSNSTEEEHGYSRYGVQDDKVPVPGTARRRRRRDATQLGSDFCKGQTKDDDDTDDGSPGGILSIVGKAGSDLFGMVDWDTVKVMDKHICDLAHTADINRQEIVRAEHALSSISQTIQNRITTIESGMTAVNDRVTETQNELIRISREQIAADNNLLRNQKRIELAQRQRIMMQEQINKYRQLVFSHSMEIDQWITALNRLLEGYLPEQFVGVEDLQRLIDMIVNNVIPEYGNRFDVLSKNPAFYYKLRDLGFVRSSTSLYITLKVPIYETGGLLQAYRVMRVHSSTAQHHESSTIVHNLPDYFTIDKNNLYYSEMTTTEYINCRGSLLRVCRSERSLIPTNSHMTCAAAIFLGKAEAIKSKCEIGYEASDLPSIAIQVGQGRYLIHSQGASSTETWTMSCPFSESQAHRIQQIQSCRTCYVTVPCGCSLDATDFFIGVRMTGCEVGEHPSRPEVVVGFPVNLHMMSRLYTPDQLAKWYPHTTTSEPWKLENVDLRIENDEWPEVVEQEDKYRLDFNKIMEKHKTSEQIWASKASYYLRKAMDMNDVNMAGINGLKETMGTGIWKSIMNPKSIISSSSFSIILSVLVLIGVIYVLYRGGR